MTEKELVVGLAEASKLRIQVKAVLAVMNPLLSDTLKIDLNKDYNGLFDCDKHSGKYEVTEKNAL